MAKRQNKGGRPPKITAENQAVAIGALSAGGSLADAAAIIRVDVSSLRRFKANNPSFKRGVMEATAVGKMLLVAKVKDSPDWKAAAWMLERKWGKEFGRREPVKIEHSGKNGGPIETKSEVKHAVDYAAIENELGAIRMAGRASSDN